MVALSAPFHLPWVNKYQSKKTLHITLTSHTSTSTHSDGITLLENRQQFALKCGCDKQFQELGPQLGINNIFHIRRTYGGVGCPSRRVNNLLRVRKIVFVIGEDVKWENMAAPCNDKCHGKLGEKQSVLQSKSKGRLACLVTLYNWHQI